MRTLPTCSSLPPLRFSSLYWIMSLLGEVSEEGVMIRVQRGVFWTRGLTTLPSFACFNHANTWWLQNHSEAVCSGLSKRVQHDSLFGNCLLYYINRNVLCHFNLAMVNCQEFSRDGRSCWMPLICIKKPRPRLYENYGLA